MDLAPLFAQLMDERPTWRVSLKTGRSGELVALVAQKVVDVGLVAATAIPGALVARPLYSDMYAFFGRAGARYRAVRDANVVTVLDACDDDGTTLAEHLRRQGIATPRLTCDSFELAMRLAVDGIAAGVLPLRVARRHVALGMLERIGRPFPPAFGPHKTFIVHRKFTADEALAKLVASHISGRLPG